MAREHTLILGSVALLLWGIVLLRERKTRFGWISPTGLFALGVLVFYVVPSLYWQFRPWRYWYPPYFEGLPLVMGGAAILALPFLLGELARKVVRSARPPAELPSRESRGRVDLPIAGDALWLAAIPVVLGAAWRMWLFAHGWQARLERDFDVAGSVELTILGNNLPYVAPIFYYLLVAYGGPLQRRVGCVFWGFDGLLQVFSLHRHAILAFAFSSAVFLALLGRRPHLRHWLLMAMVVVLVIVVIGGTSGVATTMLRYDQRFLSPAQVVDAIEESFGHTLASGQEYGESFAMKSLDDTLDRLYDARSASAVMMNVPDVIPYWYGRSLLHIFAAWIPRFFWPGKPDLGEIHLVTKRVMPHDSGVNPCGTIAELFVNLDFAGVLIGGFFCWLICRSSEWLLSRPGRIHWATIAVYPVLSNWFVGANYNFTQRVCEGLRGLLLGAFVLFFLSIVGLCEARRTVASREGEQMSSADLRTPLEASDSGGQSEVTALSRGMQT